MGASLVAVGEPGYPPALAHVEAPPPLLYIKGRADLADFPIVAIVGARNGSAAGQKFTRQLASELGLEGFVIRWRAASTRLHIAPRWSTGPLPWWPEVSMWFTRRRTRT